MSCTEKGQRRRGWRALAIGVAFIAGTLTVATAHGRNLLPNDEAEQFIRQLVSKRGLNEAEVRSVLVQAKIKQSILDAISRPAEAKPWYKYRKIFVTPTRIEKGVAFMRRHAGTSHCA